jgi:putative ABC transport system permease protein
VSWFNRLTNIFRPGSVRNEIDEELDYHLSARIADNIAAGMTPDEARTDAIRRFGSTASALEKTRDADVFLWLGTILQDLKYGARNLRSNPSVTAVALLSIALATGTGTAIFSVVNAVLLRKLPYEQPDRIALISTTNALRGARMNVSVPNFEDWKKRARTIADLAIFRVVDSSFTVNGEPDWIDYCWVYGGFFRLLGRDPEVGRVFTDGDQEHVIVISDRLWRSRFAARPDVLGKTINLTGTDFQIIGVMPTDFNFPTKDIQLWAPAPAFDRDWRLRFSQQRDGGFGQVAGRLVPGVTLAQARTEMEFISRQLLVEYPKDNEYRGTSIIPLAVQIHGTTVPLMLTILSGSVLLVLLIACANAANLLLARGAVRAREIALRAALGAGRGRILRQLVTESLLLSILAGLLGLPVAAWGVRALIALAPAGIARVDEAQIDATVLIFSLGLSITTGLLFGLAPSIRISREVRDQRQTRGIDSRALRRAFVVSQVGLAVVLLTGAGLLIRSFAAVQAVDPGFSPRVLSATLRFRNNLPGDRRAALYRDAMVRLNETPGVTAAGAISAMFFIGDDSKFGLRAVEGHPPESREKWAPMNWTTISGNYFQALGVPLLRGRFFNDRDTKDSTPVVIINETMARRYFPGEEPIGKGIKGFDPRGRNDEWVRIVGVVKDMHSAGLEHAPVAQIYQAQAQWPDETENIVVRTDAHAAVLRNAIKSVDSTAVWMDVSTLGDRLRQQNASRRFETLLLALFAGLALALAGSGIFAMLHYAVTQRRQEIGVRMAIGAREIDIVRMILGEGFLLLGAGAGVGLAGALALTRIIRSLLFEVSPEDPVTLSAVLLVLAGVGLAACYIPSHRATQIDPILALRYE